MDRNCLNDALRLLGRREYGSAELGRKLAQRGFSASQIAGVVAECERLNYLDDRRFSDSFAQHQSRKGFGVMRIAHMLRERGLPTERIQECLDRHCSEESQIEDCRRALAKKLKTSSVRTRADLPQRLYRFLQGRGFTTATIRRAFAEEMPQKEGPTALEQVDEKGSPALRR